MDDFRPEEFARLQRAVDIGDAREVELKGVRDPMRVFALA